MSPKKRRKKKKAPKTELLYSDGHLFLLVRGVMQSDEKVIATKGRVRAVAFHVTPHELLTIARGMLRAIMPHAKQCGDCSGDLASIVDEVDDFMWAFKEDVRVPKAEELN